MHVCGFSAPKSPLSNACRLKDAITRRIGTPLRVLSGESMPGPQYKNQIMQQRIQYVYCRQAECGKVTK